MANHKSAIKRIRQTVRRTARNRVAKSQLRTQLKKFRAAVEGQGDTAPDALLSSTTGLIDRSVRKGVLHPNKANRLKSSISRAADKAAQRSAS